MCFAITTNSLPTLWLNECVMIYMDPARGDHILSWIAAEQPEAAMITFEQIHPNDAFGRMMLQNLKVNTELSESHGGYTGPMLFDHIHQSRGIELPGLHAYPSLERQLSRYRDICGWQKVRACDMNAVYERWIEDDEKRRVAKIELLDELEEWRMIMAHYCLVVAWSKGLLVGAACEALPFAKE